ncbi:MAG: alkyl hydroperoxide reductase [Coxiella sp. (in: Bacteria)]|nr:MAG: alkyl hydroperoxide reductase [Coxiella sp. (in: g-proteobacteria)]
MSIETVVTEIPDTAKDIRLNFSNLLQDQVSGLTEQQIKAIIYAVAISVVPSNAIKTLMASFEEELDESLVRGAHVASGLMSMNNIYYRFVHLGNDHELSAMNPGLRMQGMRTHGIDETLFELMSLAISAINGCGMCIQAHIKTLKAQGAELQTIQMSAKIAAVLNAMNQVNFKK